MRNDNYIIIGFKDVINELSTNDFKFDNKTVSFSNRNWSQLVNRLFSVKNQTNSSNSNSLPIVEIEFDSNKKQFYLNDKNDVLKIITSRSKIYLFAHGSYKFDDYAAKTRTIFPDIDTEKLAGNLISYKELARLIINGLPKDKTNFRSKIDTRLQITLATCYASTMRNEGSNFSTKFHHELYTEGKIAPFIPHSASIACR